MMKFAGVFAAILLAMSANAETFVVTKTADEIGPCIPGDCALREAVLAANAALGLDTIIVPAGRYLLSIEGREEDDGLTGDLDVHGDVAILGAGAGRTVLDAGGIDRVMDLFVPPPATAFSTLEDLTITGGAGLDDSPINGGGLALFGSDVTFRRSVITGNAALNGGGLFVANASASLIDSSVVGNSATQKGGGIARLQIGFEPRPLQIVNTTISGNSAFRGGGIAYENFGTMELRHSTIADNVANFASAIDFDSVQTEATRYRNIVVRGTCDSFQSGLPASDGGNLESPGHSCGLSHVSDQDDIPDLLLGPLSDNGGPTPTQALLPGSPAIDAALSPCEPADQRGRTRPVDGDENGTAECDAGAFELVPVVEVVEVPVGRGALMALAALLAFAGWRRSSI